MKRLLILLSLLFLLTGCQTKTPEATAPAITTPTEVPQTTQATEPPHLPLLDQAESVGTSGNIMYIPNSHVESMFCPAILRFGDDLLLYEEMPMGGLQLKLVSLDDGSLLAEATYPSIPTAKVQVDNGFVSVCDPVSSQILFLNNSLVEEKSYTVPAEGDTWYLNPEAEILYEFFSDEGLLSRDLATGEAQWMLENAAFVQSYGAENGYVLFSYTDREDQKTYNGCLDLSSGTLETLPVEAAICSGTRYGEQWLLRQDVLSGKYILIHSGDINTFVFPEGFSKLLPDKQQLLIIDGNYQELFLYDLEGNFLSQCILPQIEYASVGTDLVWSDYWQGYFFQYNYDGVPHLMLWDPSIPQEGENLSWEAKEPPEHVMEQEFYDRAAALSQRFGIDIRIAEQCALEYTTYQSNMLVDPYSVQYALDVLEQALSTYPEGFFNQLLYGSLQKIQIELVDSLYIKDETGTHPPTANGFATQLSDYHLIVLDGIDLGVGTVYHEFSHIIDQRLEWDAQLRPEALYSEETWLSLQPEGFYYANSYIDFPEDVLAFEYSGSFIRRYSMTFPTEDRATLMAFVMEFDAASPDNPLLAKKIRYYAECIRDCFDTEGWPKKTIWE